MGLQRLLRGLSWDGFHLAMDLATDRDVELDVDGVRFMGWQAGHQGRLRQGFGFTPNGDDRMQLQVRCQGFDLHDPVQVQWGVPGFQPGRRRAPPMLLLDPYAEQYLVAGGAPVAASPVVIIVPVFNAARAVARCLTSLREFTAAGAELLLIDDASTDVGIAPLLQMASGWPHVKVLRNERNLGFTGTVNRGLAECPDDADVVLLNADTEVGPGWLAGLRQAVWSDPKHATATAVSNNAGAFSVPELEHNNPLPSAWSMADASRAVLHEAGRAFPRLPTGNGFCMYMRHDARAEIGELDAQAFPAGYGEENDWCQRAEALGWQHVIAGSVFVGHARSQSFGAARRQQLGEAGMAVLRQRYPDYEDKVAASLGSFPRRVLDWRVRRLWQDAMITPRPRVLLLDDKVNPEAWHGWSIWRTRLCGETLRLLDGDANECSSVAVGRSRDGVCMWLQRHGFEAVAAADEDADGDTRRMVGTLGLPMAAAPDGLVWAFR